MSEVRKCIDDDDDDDDDIDRVSCVYLPVCKRRRLAILSIQTDRLASSPMQL